MVGLVAALALTSGLFHAVHRTDGRDVHVHYYRQAGWHFTVRQDRFQGKTTCRIYKHDVTFAEGVVTFQFGHGVDTANARFRLDDGPPRDVGSVAVEAAGLGASFNGPNMRNPSNGEVHIPAAVIGAATRVAIQPNAATNHRTFSLAGLSRALEVAKAQSCNDLAGRASLSEPAAWRHRVPAPWAPNRPG